MDLTVVIVNYNVQYFLEQALLSVQKASTNLSVEVFVVDNNSVDNSVKMVREKFPEVLLIDNQENVGFSTANNQAIRQAKGRYVLLLNPDTVVEEHTFEKCVDFMDARPEVGALGVKMIDGSGKFLPESKRGFPSPLVAFYKTFGLSRLFPRSKTFNHYHLGYLDKDQNHEIEVLAGAFMFMRTSVLDKVGLLDEAFFMYGEDIDLSYRIVKGGYKNYYLADTTIIHYKGESTKKGSLNYVKVFYNAMIIFARKHFQGEQARLFILMLHVAIYFRAFLTLISNLFRQAYLPVLDALVIFGGMFLLKDFWATYYFNDPAYYQDSFLYFNTPLYILIWLGAVFFSGGYDRPISIRRLGRGLFVGTIFLAAVYGFLDLAYRPSRALILLGAIWAFLSTTAIRMFLHFIRFGNFELGNETESNLVIVGSKAESRRVEGLLHQVGVFKNFIGTVASGGESDMETYLSSLHQLDEVVQIYKVDEIIFCSKDVSSQDIMHWMSHLGPDLSYKIVPKESDSIIGSNSKNTSGELYTVDIRFRIASPEARRNKRLLDLMISGLLLLLSPFLIFMVKSIAGFFRNMLAVLIGQKTWVAYAPSETLSANLPKIRKGILNPLDALDVQWEVNDPTRQRLNFFYAKDYQSAHDLEIVWKGMRELGRRE